MNAPSEDVRATLIALDARQKELVTRADAAGLEALSSVGLTLNAPTNRVMQREEFLAGLRSGQVGPQAFERTVENVSVSGPVGVVMGSEVFTPKAGTELAATFGERPLKRRYTNVYVLEAGEWKWFARHVNVCPGG